MRYRQTSTLAKEQPFAVMRSLAMRFNGILRGDRSDPLDAWIEDAMDSGLAPIMRFARVLRRDIDAERNRTTVEQWSGRRSDQPPQDPQAGNVWQSRPRTAEGTNAATAPHKVMVWNGPSKRHRRCLSW